MQRQSRQQDLRPLRPQQGSAAEAAAVAVAAVAAAEEEAAGVAAVPRLGPRSRRTSGSRESWTPPSRRHCRPSRRRRAAARFAPRPPFRPPEVASACSCAPLVRLHPGGESTSSAIPLAAARLLYRLGYSAANLAAACRRFTGALASGDAGFVIPRVSWVCIAFSYLIHDCHSRRVSCTRRTSTSASWRRCAACSRTAPCGRCNICHTPCRRSSSAVRVPV